MIALIRMSSAALSSVVFSVAMPIGAALAATAPEPTCERALPTYGFEAAIARGCGFTQLPNPLLDTARKCARRGDPGSVILAIEQGATTFQSVQRRMGHNAACADFLVKFRGVFGAVHSNPAITPVPAATDRVVGNGRNHQGKQASSLDGPFPEIGGEGQSPYVHNGSRVAIFPKHGVIAYFEPKAALNGIVRRGDVIFRGTITQRGIFGTAFVFKPGCPPLGYAVRGGAYRSDGDPIVLEGTAPVRAKGTCSVVAENGRGSNAVLRFEPAGGSNEPEFVSASAPLAARTVAGPEKGPPETSRKLPFDATPRQVVDYIYDSNDFDLVADGDKPIKYRIFSSMLLERWSRAEDAASRFDEPFLDANWITGQQDMEVASRKTEVKGNTVVARLKGKTGERGVVTFRFLRERDAWRISDVAYGDGANPGSLAKLSELEISKDERTPYVSLPILPGRWSSEDCAQRDPGNTRFFSAGISWSEKDQCIAKATPGDGKSFFALQFGCTTNHGDRETRYYQAVVQNERSMQLLGRGKEANKTFDLKYCGEK